MNLDDLYLKIVMEAKRCEVFWFHMPTDGLGHAMPFLSRNLLYIRRARRSSPITEWKKVSSNPNKDKQKKLDLLFSIFHHRTFIYNDALFASPRRATRNLIQASSQNTTPVPNKENCSAAEAGSPEQKKRKHNAVEDEDSSRDSVPAKKLGQSWTRKLEAIDKRRMSVSPLSSSDESGGLRPLHRKGRSGPYLSTTAKAETRMFFHLPFIDKNGAPSIHVEEVTREERRCPFCFHNAMSDSGLVMHCSASHGEGLVFKAARSELGELHLSATPKPDRSSSQAKEHLEDFVFVTSSPTTLPAVPFVKRPTQNIASLDRAARKKKARLLEEMGADARDTQRYVLDDKVPIRAYYHSKTKQPMLNGDWDVDSDNDSTDDQWLRQIGASLLDDFEDVSENEKKFLKVWNGFIQSHTLISDFSIPGQCMDFVRAHASYLNANNLRDDLTLHLYNLWDNGLVSSSHILECMMEYDSLTWGECGA